MNPPEVLDHRADLAVRLQHPYVREVWRDQLALDIEKANANDAFPKTETRNQAAGQSAALIDAVDTAECFHVSADMVTATDRRVWLSRLTRPATLGA